MGYCIETVKYYCEDKNLWAMPHLGNFSNIDISDLYNASKVYTTKHHFLGRTSRDTWQYSIICSFRTEKKIK